jgi:hypothetical protein
MDELAKVLAEYPFEYTITRRKGLDNQGHVWAQIEHQLRGKDLYQRLTANATRPDERVSELNKSVYPARVRIRSLQWALIFPGIVNMTVGARLSLETN